MNAVTGNDILSPLERIKSLIANLELWQSHIESALRHGNNTHTFEDIVGMIFANRLFFFTYPRAFVVMEVVQYPQFKVFHCFLAGGEMDDLLDVFHPMKKLAAEMECRYITIAGRKGWMKELGKRGWHHVCSTMAIEVGDAQ